MRRLVTEAHEAAVNFITERRQALEELAQTLLEEETLDGDEVKAIVNGTPRPEKKKDPAAAQNGAGEESGAGGSGQRRGAHYRRGACPAGPADGSEKNGAG